MNRRDLLAGSVALVAGSPVIAGPARADGKTRVRVGYLHRLSVDGQIWTGLDRGFFDRQDLLLDLVRFETGLEAFEALGKGALDMVVAGAGISNFPPRGGSKVFLVNDVEVATAQLWVRGDAGIKSVADLKGRQIATLLGTTAQVFLDRALKANKVEFGDVGIVNMPMTAAVSAFMDGAVPAIALSVPFNVPIRDAMPNAVKLDDAAAYYPQASVVGGWAARTDYFDANRPVLGRIVAGWADANDWMIANSDEALKELGERRYPNLSPADLQEQFKAQKMFTARDWKRLYADGTVATWLQRTTDFFLAAADVPTPLKATAYFDPKVFLDAVG